MFAKASHYGFSLAQALQNFEEGGEGFAAAGWIFDCEPGLAVAHQIERAEDAKAHGEAVVFVGVDAE